MTHDQAHAELDAVAFDLLDAPEKAAVLAHVEQCVVCRKELDLRRSIVADLAFAAPLSTDTATGGRMRIRERLMSRAMADSQARRMATPPIVFPTPPVQTAIDPVPAAPARGWGRGEWMAIAAGILFAATLGLWGTAAQRWNDAQARLAAQTDQAVAARRSADSLIAVVAGRDSLIAGLAGRDIVVPLADEHVAAGACVQAAAALLGKPPAEVAAAWSLDDAAHVLPDARVDAAAIRASYAATHVNT